MKKVTIKPKHKSKKGQTSQILAERRNGNDILVERRNGNDIVIVTLNRPEVGNIIDRNMHQVIEDIGHQLIYDDDVRAVILTGAGNDFCVGTNLQDVLNRAETRYNTAGRGLRSTRSPMRMVENILNIRAPVISAVRGRAHGIGATIALFGDVVIAADDAEFLDDHVVQGNVAGDGGACMWPLLIGPARAKWHLMTGDPISAGEAERIGLVNKVVPAAELMPTALAFAERLCALPPLAVKWSKMTVNKYLKFVLHEVGDLGIALEYHTARSEDHLSAVRAIVNKTPFPRFEGK